MPGTEDASQPAKARRRRNPDRTRAAILTAATAEFATRGFDGASVNEIALAARVNKRMLYHYFISKEGLYAAVLESAYVEFRDVVGAVRLAELPPADAVRALVTTVFDHVTAHPEFLRLSGIENMSGGEQARKSRELAGILQPLIAAFAAVLRRGTGIGAFREVDPLQLWMTILAVTSVQAGWRHTIDIFAGVDPVTPEALAARRRHVVDVVLATLEPGTASRAP